MTAAHHEIVDLLHAYHRAMMTADTGTLELLLAPAFSLVHITGFVQAKDAWYDVMRTGQFNYHAIDVDAASLALQLANGSAQLEGRGVFDATIDGMHRPWRLQFTLRLARLEGAWRIMQARYTPY